jgi:release factor glutamine methyltransferase
MKLKEVFEKSVQFFKDKKIESARLDAELVLAHALKIDRLQIYLKYEQPLTDAELQNCREVVRRRSLGEPVAYILGERGFFKEVFKVGEGVLIPRPETELLVEEALEFIKKNNIENPQIIDLGAGTGCVGFSILKNCESASLVSIEKSEKAFGFLKLNQQALGLDSRSELHLQDVRSYQTEHKFDVVIANPPYISINDPTTETNVKKFEPSEALFSDQEGYKDLYDWSQKFAPLLKPNGIMLFEMGCQQGQQLKKHFEDLKCFQQIQVLKDLSGLDRAIKAHNNNNTSPTST